MAYTKTTWTDGTGQAINAVNLNKIETGIKDAHTGSVIKGLYEAEANTNAFTDAEKTKLGNCITQTDATTQVIGGLATAWQNCGTIGTTINAVAEPLVDATFRVVTAFDQSSGLNNVTADLGANTLTITDAGLYNVAFYTKFAGSAKDFEFALFVNGIESALKVADQAQEHTSVVAVIDLPAGAILDMRQRSTNGGTTLTMHTAGISIHRLT